MTQQKMVAAMRVLVIAALLPLGALAALSSAGCGSDSIGPPDAPASPWSTTTPLPEPRLESGVAANGTQVVVIGGYSSSLEQGLAVSRQVLVLDTFAETWTPVTPEAPVAWTHASVATAAGSIFLLGGLDQQLAAHGDAYVLDLGARVWEAMTPMPAGEERGAAAVVVYPPFVYLFGGSATVGALATNLAIDTSSSGPTRRGVWSALPPLPAPRSHAAAMRMANGTFIVTGGFDGQGKPLADTLELAPNATAWTATRKPMPTARGGCAYGVVLGELVCAGGETEAAALSVVEGYDPIRDVWMTYPPLPVPRAGIHGAVVGQRLFIPGGSESLRFEPTPDVFVFSPLDTLPRARLGSKPPGLDRN